MKKIIFLVALITLVAFVSGAMAQQQKPAPAKAAVTPAVTPAPAAPAATKAAPVKIEKFSGAIEKIDEMTKAVVVKGKKEEKTFATDDKTKITKGKELLPFADLKKGMNVSIGYKKDGDKMVAVTIKASAPKAAPKKVEEKPAEKK